MSILRSGAYWLEFQSNLNTKGIGTLIVSGPKLAGGDGGYIYRGFVTGFGGIYRGRVAVIRVDRDAVSLFGSVDRFELEISGLAIGSKIAFSGFVRGAEHLRVRFSLTLATALAAE